MALLVQSLGIEEKTWRDALSSALPDVEVRFWPDLGRPEDIEYVAVARLPHGTLASLPNLKLVCSLMAGQDGLLADRSIPKVPIVRTDTPDGDQSMTETVLMHVLRHYRRLPDYAAQQQRFEWKRLPQKLQGETCVGFLGLGLFGLAAAQCVRQFGFRVAGWSRRPKSIEGIASYAGPDGLFEMLKVTDIVVNLLPLTPETINILNRDALGCMPKGSALINLGRGAHLPEADLYWALDAGYLAAATLDVFDPEPPPREARVWTDPRITITPHVARAHFDVPRAAQQIARAIIDLRAGRVPAHLVDVELGY